MKKAIILLIIGLFLFSGSQEENIRIRVLANSNSEYDQKIKNEVVNILTSEFKNILSNEKDIDNARLKINDNLDVISTKIDDFLAQRQIKYGYNINYGLNYFPLKENNGRTYEEGYYESVLVTLGEGAGDNWWCILFPSICLTEEDGNYQSIIKNLFNKIFY